MFQIGSTLRRTVFVGIIAGGFLLSLHAPTRADIVVCGSDSRKAGDLNTWCDRHIPAVFHPQTDVVVRALSDADMNAYLNGGNRQEGSNKVGDDSNDDIDGVFENDPPRITLRMPQDGPPDMLTFAHEYGHFVWFDLMSRADHKRYEAIYKKQRAAHHLVTRYASTDLEEGFAEAFSFYVNGPDVLEHRDPASYQFLADWQANAERSDTTRTRMSHS